MQTRRFAAFAWGVLAFNVLVIGWGAFVRATGSGAGCGRHWPLCNGEVLPRAPELETLIEFSHRTTSGIAFLLVAALVPMAWRAFGRGHRVRVMALISLAFILLEALLGPGLVLLEYVAHNASVARAYWVAGHLINTFFLLAVLTLTAWWGGGAPPVRLRGQPGLLVGTLAAALVGMLILGASGGVTALGDTLLLTAGITPEQSPLVATLVDLRIYHPLLAFAVGGLIVAALLAARSLRPSPVIYRLGWWLGGIYTLQLLVGAFNVVLKAPVAMQLIHLLISDMIWIALVLLAANALAVAVPVIAGEASPSTSAPLAGRTI
jgi:heme A synthase